MAFDRTFGFVFTNFSKHEVAWTADGITFNGSISGIQKITRTCPVIIYQTKESAESALRYFVRACAQVPELGLDGKMTELESHKETVSNQLYSCFCLSTHHSSPTTTAKYNNHI